MEEKTLETTAVELMDKHGETAIQGIDGFFTKLTQAAEVVGAKLVEVAPDVADAILNLVQFKGIFEIVTSGILLAIAVTASFKIFPKLWKWMIDYAEESDGASCLLLLPMFALGSLDLIALGAFFEFYNWISAIYPEGAIAMKALEAAGIAL